jgi:hypothetical protein
MWKFYRCWAPLRTRRLFGGMRNKKPIRLINARTLGDGLIFLTYEMVRSPEHRQSADSPRIPRRDETPA